MNYVKYVLKHLKHHIRRHFKSKRAAQN